MKKKIFIGITVLFTYALYTVGIRHQRPVISKPISLASSASSSSSNNASASNSNSTKSTSSSSSTTTSSPSSSSNSTPAQGKYKDGTYVGASENVYYGNVQVSVSITNGRIADVKFLSYPNQHSTSVYINQQVMPYLKQEALQSQNSNVQIISGATFTCQGFIQSLASALSKA